MSCPCATARGPEKEICSTASTSFLTLPSFRIETAPSDHVELCAGGEITRKHDLLGARGDVDEAARARRHMRPDAELRDIDGAALVDLQEREQRHVEARPLEVGELVRRLNDRLGVGGAAELEVEQAARRRPRPVRSPRSRRRARPSSIRMRGTLAEMPKPILTASPSRSSCATRRAITFAMSNLGVSNDDKRPEDLAGDRRLVDGVGRLQLVGRDDDIVDHDARDDHIVRPERIRRRRAA